MIISAALTKIMWSCAAYGKNEHFYGHDSLIQASLLQVSAAVTLFSEILNHQHQKKVSENIQKF